MLSTRLVSDERAVARFVKRYCSSVMVWNFMLDRDMKPNLDGGCQTCYGAVDIDNSDYTTFAYNSFYYIIAHMSVWRGGAVRIATNDYSQTGLDYCAFRNTDGTTSIVLDNSSASSMTVPVTDGTYSMNVSLPRKVWCRSCSARLLRCPARRSRPPPSSQRRQFPKTQQM